jgi:Na+/glutamate symporter
VAVAGAGSGIEASATLRKNGTSIALQGGWGAVTGAISQLVQFNGTTDYVDVAITNGTTGNVVQSATQTTFNGFWVRP